MQMIDQKQVETVEYCKYLRSTITNDARCTLEIKSSRLQAIGAFNKKTHFVSKLVLNLIKKLVKFCISITFLYGADTWALRKLDRKYLGSFFNVMLEEDGEDQLGRSCQILSIMQGNILIDWSHLAWEQPSITRYERKDRYNWKNTKKT